MKTLLTLALSISLTVAYAQSGTSTPVLSSTTQSTPTLSAKQKTLVKEWKFDRSESFDLVQKPTDVQKGDLLNLMENGRYRLIMDGQAEGGTWTVDAACKWITLTKDDGTVKKFQILSQTDTELKIDYRDGDGTHNVLIYATKAAGAVPAGR